MFQVLLLEQPELRLEWQPDGFPTGELLKRADAGICLQPSLHDGLRALTLDASPMAVAMAVGHRLSTHDELSVADVLDEPFAGTPAIDGEWARFWTLDDHRGGPAAVTDDDVRDAEQVLEVVAGGRAIATVPAWMSLGLPHPGIVTLPLRDGPLVETKLVWRVGDENPMIAALVDLARAWTGSDGAH
jgi:DNA-binding transcriptional LysR family regulator